MNAGAQPSIKEQVIGDSEDKEDVCDVNDRYKINDQNNPDGELEWI